MVAGWAVLILIGFSVTFAYHLWLGWSTRVIRLPLSLLAFQEFERDDNPANFWGIAALNTVLLIAGLCVAYSIASNAFAFGAKPISQARSLNGCYAGDGLPDFMRPRLHWTFRIDDGAIIDRNGNTISRISLRTSTQDETSVTFNPGISISSDSSTKSMVSPGDVIGGKAYESGGITKIALADDWGVLMHQTSCK